LRIVTGSYRTLQSVAGRYGTLQKHWVLWSITEHYRALRDVMGRYGTIRKRYSFLTECYGTVMENIDLPVTN